MKLSIGRAAFNKRVPGVIMQVLIIDDDEEWCTLLASPLTREGFEVHIETSADNAIEHIDKISPSIVVLDLSFPYSQINGFDIATELGKRQSLKGNNFRLILVSSRHVSETDMRLGFSVGADDYWPKPFSTGLLTQYIVNCRNRMDTAVTEHIYLDKKTYYDPVNGLFSIDGKEVLLTAQENDFMIFLASDNMSRKSQDQIEKNVWKRDFVELNAVQRCVSDIRKKLYPNGMKFIETKYGQGYRLKNLSE